ncbi:MAG: hypothetical protein JRI68_06495 [Deltaproteobacteria bacterium]|nr:hypothetical protein [Deltaproteobacteria bacterium]
MPTAIRATFLAACVIPLGCNALWGIDELGFGPAGDAGHGGVGGSGTTTAGGGGSTSSGTGGAGGAGGTQPHPTGDHVWSHRFGGTLIDRGESVAVDAAGNVILFARFRGEFAVGGETFTNPPGDWTDDLLVIKLNPDGDILWAKAFGDVSDQDPADVAVDTAGDILLTGEFAGTLDFGTDAVTANGRDPFVAKLSGDGAHLWTRSAGGPLHQTGRAVATGTSNNVVVVGHFEGTLDFGDGLLQAVGAGDVYLVKLNPSGTTLWTRHITGPAQQSARDVAIAPDGSIAVLGGTIGAVDFGEGAKTGGVGDDGFVAKYDPLGGLHWAVVFGGSGALNPQSVAFDSAGQVVVVGTLNGQADCGQDSVTSIAHDAFVARFSGDLGTCLSNQLYGGAGDQLLESLAIDSHGNLVMAGDFGGTVDFGGGTLTAASWDSPLLVKLSGGLDHWWSQAFGDAATTSRNLAAVAPTGHVIMAGSFTSSVDFGGGALTSAGERDIYVAKFLP